MSSMFYFVGLYFNLNFVHFVNYHLILLPFLLFSFFTIVITTIVCYRSVLWIANVCFQFCSCSLLHTCSFWGTMLRYIMNYTVNIITVCIIHYKHHYLFRIACFLLLHCGYHLCKCSYYSTRDTVDCVIILKVLSYKLESSIMMLFVVLNLLARSIN